MDYLSVATKKVALVERWLLEGVQLYHWATYVTDWKKFWCIHQAQNPPSYLYQKKIVFIINKSRLKICLQLSVGQAFVVHRL